MKHLKADSGIYFQIREQRERYHPTMPQEPEGPWRSFFDQKSQRTFYHQSTTDTSVWDLPANAVLEDSESDPEPDTQVPPVDDATTEFWPGTNFYGQLGVPGSASLQDINKAFRKIARTCHPDKCIDTEEGQATEYMKKVNEAYEVLKDQKKRQRYNEIQRYFGPTLQFTPTPRVRHHTELAQVKATPKARRLAMLEPTPKPPPTDTNDETGPNTFDSYASEGLPFDAWWSEGPFDDWESKGSSAFDSWWSRGDVADGWQQWNKWVPGAKWEPDERCSNIDQEEVRKTEKSEAQGRAQSSQDAWISTDEIHQGTQTVEIKVEDSEDEKPSVIAKKKSRRGKRQFRLGKRDRAAEKERLEKEKRDQEKRDQASSELEVPMPSADDEGSMSRMSRCTVLL